MTDKEAIAILVLLGQSVMAGGGIGGLRDTEVQEAIAILRPAAKFTVTITHRDPTKNAKFINQTASNARILMSQAVDTITNEPALEQDYPILSITITKT